MTKKALVIGGSGFIGSHVADLLSQKKIEVTIFDQKPSNWLKTMLSFVTENTLLKKSCDIILFMCF